MSLSNDHHARQVAQKLADYALLYQQCSDQVRLQGGTTDRFIAIHDEAYKEWTSDPTNPLFGPPLGNEKAKAAYFAKCDEICRSKPQNLHDLCKVTFACWAGIQVMQSQELASMLNGEEVMETAKQLSIDAYVKLNPQTRLLPDDPESMDPHLPSHLERMLYPDTTAHDDGPNLIGQTIRFRDQTTGETMACTVRDCGTSKLRGDWFEVVFGDEEMRIMTEEMKEMLSSRIR